MSRLFKILVILLLSFPFMGNDGIRVSGKSVGNGFDILLNHTGHFYSIDNADLSDEFCYNDWNTLEIASGANQVVPVRVHGSGSERTSESLVSGAHLKSSFSKNGKIESVVRSVQYCLYAGLLPSGMASFSKHLISLRKIRI